MNRQIAILLSLFLVTLIGCQKTSPTAQHVVSPLASVTTPDISSPVIERPATTIPPSVTNTVTVVLASPTPTSSPTVTSIPTQEISLPPVRQCVEIQPLPSHFSDLYGQLVLDSILDLRNPYLLNLKTGEKSHFPQNDAGQVWPGDFNVSPNREWIAYIGGETAGSKEYRLIVQSVNSENKYSYPLNDEEWNSLFSWVNDNWLALVKLIGGASLDDLVMFNPFTGEKQQMPKKFPDILDDDWNWQMGWPTITVYGPTLDRMVYVGKDENYSMKLVFWDVTENQAVREIPHIGYTFSAPQWSLDGNRLLFVQEPERYVRETHIADLVLVEWNGEVTRLTNFADHYQQAKIYSYSWSPDGKTVAFWLIVNYAEKENAKVELVILDIATKGMVNTCINTHNSPAYGPVWSLDSQFIAVGLVSPDKTEQTVLVNIQNGSTFLVAEGYIPFGWVSSP